MLKYQNRIKLILLRLVLIVSMLRLVEGKARGASSMFRARALGESPGKSKLRGKQKDEGVKRTSSTKIMSMQKVSTGRGGGAANKLPTVLQFLGEAYDSGDKGNLDIINEMAGTSVTVNEAIERSGLVHEGTFIGCHVVQMVAFGNHKEQVGVGAECMWEVDDGMNGITFFMFDCGTLVHSSQTALAYYPPSIVGSNSQLEYGNMESPPVSYLVGSQPIYGESTIVDSTGCFNDFHGSARVSGFLGKSPASMWFNYIWEIYPETQEAGYTVI